MSSSPPGGSSAVVRTLTSSSISLRSFDASPGVASSSFDAATASSLESKSDEGSGLGGTLRSKERAKVGGR